MQLGNVEEIIDVELTEVDAPSEYEPVEETEEQPELVEV